MAASRVDSRGSKNKGGRGGGAKNGRARGARGRAKEVLRTTAGTVTLLPFDLRGEAKRRGTAPAFFPLRDSAGGLKEDRPFVSLI